MKTFNEFLTEEDAKELTPYALQSKVGGGDIKQYGDKWNYSWFNDNEKMIRCSSISSLKG